MFIYNLDLTDTESRVLMGSWLNADPSSLSTYVGEIVKYCRGSPMAIGLICPILKRKNTETRWKEIAAQLATKALVLRASTKENKKCTLNGSIELRYHYNYDINYGNCVLSQFKLFHVTTGVQHSYFYLLLRVVIIGSFITPTYTV